ICNKRFKGKIVADKATFPFAIDVNIIYQSVQGVTINIIKPIHNAGLSDRNSIASIHANMGVQTKFMMIVVDVNFKFLKDDFILLIGICKKVIYIIANSNVTIKNSAF